MERPAIRSKTQLNQYLIWFNQYFPAKAPIYIIFPEVYANYCSSIKQGTPIGSSKFGPHLIYDFFQKYNLIVDKKIGKTRYYLVQASEIPKAELVETKKLCL